eukprot:Gb_13564 [translate_table: standard]
MPKMQPQAQASTMQVRAPEKQASEEFNRLLETLKTLLHTLNTEQLSLLLSIELAQDKIDKIEEQRNLPATMHRTACTKNEIFSAGGIIRLPKFDVVMTKAEVNKKPVLGPEDVHIAIMYGRIYCLQVDRVGMQLNLYRFYRDAVVHQGLPHISCFTCCSESLNLDPEIASVKRIFLAIYSGIMILISAFPAVLTGFSANLFNEDSKAPISAPLPLLVRGPPGSTGFSARNNDRHSGSSSQAAEVKTLTTDEGVVYGDGWIFLNPDVICDNIHGLLWRIHLDLEAIAASSSEVPSLLAFLQRRRLEAEKAKQLSLAVMRSIILERRSLSVIANAMDILAVSYSHAMKLANSLPGVPETAASNRTVSQHPSDSHSNEGWKAIKSDVGGSSENAQVLDSHGKSTRAEADGFEVEKEPVHASVTSSLRGSSSCSLGDTDSQENINIGHVSARLGDAPGSPLLQSHLHSDTCKEDDREDTSAKDERRMSVEAESSSSRQEKTVIQAESSEIHAGGPLEFATSDLQRSRPASTIISPDEMYKNVFALVEEEMAGDPMYLVALIVEYFRSAAAEKLKVHPGLHVLIVQLLARDERYAELAQFVSNKLQSMFWQCGFLSMQGMWKGKEQQGKCSNWTGLVLTRVKGGTGLMNCFTMALNSSGKNGYDFSSNGNQQWSAVLQTECCGLDCYLLIQVGTNISKEKTQEFDCISGMNPPFLPSIKTKAENLPPPLIHPI